MPVRTAASQSKKYFAELCFVCIRVVVLFTAFYAFLSLDSLFWVGLFEIQTDQTTQVSTQSMIKY